MTTPSGKLMWGQAGAYDGIDDREVIAALSNGRVGLAVQPANVVAGTGLNLTVRSPWLGIADCGDGTSAVIGSRTDQTVVALPGPPTGSRVDYVWADVQPDLGTWQLSVINATAAVGRSGLALATITVPANATLASQMTIAPTDATYGRRLLAIGVNTETNTRTGNSWTSVNVVVSATALAQPGHWYRITFQAMSPASISGGPDLRMGIGWRPAGGTEAQSVQQRGGSIAVPAAGRPVASVMEWVYRYPPGSPAVQRQYDGRIWTTGTGSFRTCFTTGGANGDQLSLTVEDLGT